MSDDSKIEWTDATWNPIRGCSRVSEGCRHCYAERVAARFSGPGQPYEGLAVRKLRVVSDDEQTTVGRWTGTVRMVPEHLADPLRWRRPRRVFVNSMSDLFHESLTNEQIAAVFGVMAASPRHTFQVLTKRARRMREWFEWAGRLDLDRLQAIAYSALPESDHAGCLAVARGRGRGWPLPHVWLGVSVENQAAADERIPELLRTPAAVRWISAEPLLGPVDLGRWVAHPELHTRSPDGTDCVCSRCGTRWDDDDAHECPRSFGPTLNWCVAGCESGPGARPCDVAWLRALREQCAAADVPYFLKQAVEGGDTPIVTTNGERAPAITAGPDSHRKAGGVIGLPYLDGRQHAEMPEERRRG